jgi:hypothetical protein
MRIEMENLSQALYLQGIFELPGLDSNQDNENQNHRGLFDQFPEERCVFCPFRCEPGT